MKRSKDLIGHDCFGMSFNHVYGLIVNESITRRTWKGLDNCWEIIEKWNSWSRNTENRSSKKLDTSWEIASNIYSNSHIGNRSFSYQCTFKFFCILFSLRALDSITIPKLCTVALCLLTLVLYIQSILFENSIQQPFHLS